MNPNDDALEKKVGWMIRKLRHFHRMSQHELAVASGYTQTVISKAERGEQLSLDKLGRISNVFGFTLSQFLQTADELDDFDALATRVRSFVGTSGAR